jgi:hypothetical protein
MAPRAKLSEEALNKFRQWGKRGGRQGGSEGGQTAASKLTPEERSERARRAARARWGKAKRKS